MRYTHFRNVRTPIQRRPLTAAEKLILWMAFIVVVAFILFMFKTEPSEWTNIMLQTWMI